MKLTIEDFKKYVKEKELEVNAGKSTNNKIWEENKESREKGMEVEREEDRRSEQIQICRLCISTEWKSTGICKSKSKKKRRCNKESVKNKEKIVQRRYQKKVYG